MIKQARLFSLLVAIFSTVFILKGQSVNVEILVAPPFAANISDYLDQSVLKITNTSNAPLSIMLKGTLTSNIGINGRTKDGYRPAKPIVLQPNVPLILQASKQNRVDFLDNKNIDYATGNYDINDILRTGVIPEGTYEVCISAYDYTTGLNLLSRQGIGFDCRSFNVVTPQPPIIDCDGNVPTLNGVQPLSVGAQNVVNQPIATLIRFNWLPANANGKNIIIAYDLYVLKLQDGQNPQDALQAAILNRQNNPIVFRDLRTPQYDAILATNPSLVPGRYAWAVVAKEVGVGQTRFENNGISQICAFQYNATPAPAAPAVPNQPIPLANIPEPKCECTLTPPVEDADTATLKIGDYVNIGAFKMRVNTVAKDTGGSWKGTGNIKLPIIGVRLVPILVDFQKITFTKTNDILNAKTGVATAQKHAGSPSLEPHVIKPDKPSLLPVKKEDLYAYDSYYERNRDQVLSNLKESYEGSGLQLPFGFDESDITVGIINLTFTPKQAWFDAVAGMDVPEDADVSKIGFGASGVCLKTQGLGLCGDAYLYLAQDLDIKPANLKLFGANGNNLDNACHLIIKNSKVDSAKFIGEYAFSQNVLKRADNKPEDVKVRMTFRARSWSKWYADVTMPDFKVKGAEDFIFSPKVAYYDHTDTYNPPAMPGYYTEGVVSQWQGFFMPEVNVRLPSVFKKGVDTPTDIKIQNLLIDKLGVSVKVFAEDVVDIRDGNLDGWAFSLQHLDFELLKSTFKTGKMNGKILLPIAKNDVQSQLDYNALLSYKDDTLKYTFNVIPKADIQVPMWVAKLDINQNSRIKIGNENKEKKFHAEAHLYGQMSVNSGDLGGGLPKFDLAGIKFENLYLKNYKDDNNPKDHYVGADTVYFVSGFASPPKAAGGFPLSITKFKFSPQADANASFLIDFKLSISDTKVLPEATGSLKLKGKIGLNAQNRLEPEFVGIEPSSILIKGAIGPIDVDGGLKFFGGDATYGDGIYGTLTAKMLDKKLDLGGVAAQFGSKGGRNYWFIDAVVGDAIKNVIPGVEIYKLGGGAYYNMSFAGIPDITALKAKVVTVREGLPLGKTLSGTTFTPSTDGKMGFKATTFFGVGKKEVFNADAQMLLEINTETGGVSRFVFDGSARYLESKEGTPPLAGGTLKVDYNVEQEIFAAAVGVQSQAPIPFSGKFYLYFAPQGWHIKLGRPESVEQGAAISVELLPALVAKAYFQVGNYQVDAAPELPDFVKETLTKVGVDVNMLKSSRPVFSSNNPAIAFGASLGFNAGGTFGPIYGKLQALAGFDLSLQKYDEGCNGQNEIGIGGWYANGQIYAALQAKLGIKIDLGFFDADIKILEGAAAAAIRGGGPNPFWGKGGMGIYVDLLGIIKGNVHYQFSVGTPCQPGGDGDALAKIKVITDVKPAGGVIDVDEYGSAAFNYKVGQQFTVEQFETNGAVTSRTFVLGVNDVQVSLKNKRTNAFVNTRTIYPNFDKNAIVIQPSSLLDAETDYELTVKAKMTELFSNPSRREVARRKDGSPFEETQTVTFKTNKGLETIKPERIADYNPIQKQRFFTRDESRPMGYIQMNQGYGVDNFNVPRGGGITTSAVVRFVKLDGLPNEGRGIESPINITEGGKKWEFSMPTFAPKQIYVAQVVLRWNNANATNIQDNALSTTQKTTINNNGNNYEVSEQKINEGKLSPAQNEKVIYSLAFRTSQFSTYAEKLAAMKFREMIIAVGEGNNQRKANIWLMNELSQVLPSISSLVKNALNIGNITPQLYPLEYNFWINETFDVADVNGVNVNNFTTIPPRIGFSNTAFDDWQANVFYSIQRTLQSEGAGRMWTYIGDKKATQIFSTASESVTFNTPATLLSDDEAKGLPSNLTGRNDPYNSVNGILYTGGFWQPRAMLSMKYAMVKNIPNVNVVGGILGNLNWGVNPSAAGFNAIGNAYNAGMNAAQTSVQGVSVGANIGGVSRNMNLRAK